MITNKYVEEYRQLYEDDKIKLNKERIKLLEWLDENILNNDDLYFDEEKIESCVRFCEKWYFPLEPFQKFIIAFIFLYNRETQLRVFKEFFLTMGRGAGKNGLISALSHF
ncbi:terminase large subunit, partial [Tetragenococcus halophilus]